MRKQPLIAWVILGLLLVGLLPFLITAYQIRESRNSLIDQVRQTHLVSVTATAEKIASYLDTRYGLIESIGNNPNFIQQLNSSLSNEILANTLLLGDDIIAIGVYSIDNKPLQTAKKRTLLTNSIEILNNSNSTELSPFTLNGKTYLILNRLVNNKNTTLKLLINYEKISNFLNLQSLETARLGLLNAQNEIIDGQVNNYSEFPENLKQLIQSNMVDSGADNFVDTSNIRQVAAFAKVANTRWTVISQQPAKQAEIASQRMRETALKALLGALGLCILLAWGAHNKIIRPIKELVAAQKKLLGNENIVQGGSEIDQLKQSFALLEQHIKNKDKLKSVYLGRYQIENVIASGAMGTVFKGWDPRLERFVALKTIKIGDTEGQFDRKSLVTQLVNEAKLVAKITHPNIITIFDAADSDDTAFVAMELIDGMSLSQYLKTYRAIPAQQMLAFLPAILRGLHEAHEHGIIHRDIKPGNVLLGKNGSIKLTDFGIAGIVSDQADNQNILGSPGYIAPEVLQGGEYSKQSDIFAVGVLAYRCIVGKSPFPGSDMSSRLNATITRSPLEPRLIDTTIPNALSKVIMYLLQKDPTNRPSNALLIAESLEKELGVHKWEPVFLDQSTSIAMLDDVQAIEKTRILPETIIRKKLRKK